MEEPRPTRSLRARRHPVHAQVEARHRNERDESDRGGPQQVADTAPEARHRQNQNSVR